MDLTDKIQAALAIEPPEGVLVMASIHRQIGTDMVQVATELEEQGYRVYRSTQRGARVLRVMQHDREVAVFEANIEDEPEDLW